MKRASIKDIARLANVSHSAQPNIKVPGVLIVRQATASPLEIN